MYLCIYTIATITAPEMRYPAIVERLSLEGLTLRLTFSRQTPQIESWATRLLSLQKKNVLNLRLIEIIGPYMIYIHFSLCTGCHFQTHSHHIDKRNACNHPSIHLSIYLLCVIAAMGATRSLRYICILHCWKPFNVHQDVPTNKQDVDLTGTVYIHGAAWFFNYLCLRHVNDFPRNRLRMLPPTGLPVSVSPPQLPHLIPDGFFRLKLVSHCNWLHFDFASTRLVDLQTEWQLEMSRFRRAFSLTLSQSFDKCLMFVIESQECLWWKKLR